MELELKPMTDEEKSQMMGGQPQSPSEPVVETQTPGVTPPVETPAPTVSEFQLDAFNKKFGTQYDKEELILEVLSKGTKFQEIASAKEQAEKKIAELTEVARKNVNPRSFFSSDDAYMREQLLLKNKGNEEQVRYLSNLSPSRIGKMDDYEALKLSLLIDNPELDGGEAGAVELLNEKYNFDGDLETADRATKNRILLDAKAARKSLSSLFDGIEIPDVVDWETKVQSHKDSWSVPAKELVNGISELKLSEDIAFTVDQSLKEGVFEEVLEELSRNQTSLTPEALQDAAGRVREILLLRNLDKVLKHIETTVEERSKAKFRQEMHNDKPINDGASVSGEEDLNTQTLNVLLK